MSTSTPLQLHEVSKSFGSVKALKPLTLTVKAGEMLAMLGPSGCGKTTTLRIIAGFGMPDTGSVFIGERDVTELPPNKRGLGMVFQNYSLFPHMSVAENVAFGLRMRGVNADERTRRVREMLRLVRLEKFEERSIHQLSGGQQQRVALARSLVTDPAILLLDEPLGALDRHLRERMQFELREIQKRLGITSIIVTHDQEEALTMSDRIAVMSEGQIVQIGKPIDIYQRPDTQFVSEFLGTANVFEGVVAGRATDRGWLFSIDGADTDPVPVLASGELNEGARIRVAVRPERLKMRQHAGQFPATVQDVVFRGSYYAYELRLRGRKDPIYLYSSEREALPEDGVVDLVWPDEYAILLKDRVVA